ncbi:hypothetical protein [Aeromicrobium wangtongii]|uniref:hypothetical protein n=1 Tax=Aeromicrobium wangtongii TaxID=2969247 RepID=UPI002017D33D|nr:hypothetical protein [Aeromicrobium wangtongii]MCL3818809.1 hypothetical protein [Aeromicrobium wangtongii]
MSTTRTRWGSVVAVMVIAPWMAEMSWGGIPFTDVLLVIAFLGPMYGGAAILIREVTRRAGRGWPTVLLLAAAFGVLQAGVVDQSLFNPEYARYDFQHPLHVDGIDISLYYLVAFVTGHVVVSVTVPLVLAESWSPCPGAPWLSRRGVRVVAGLYVVASVINHLGVKDEDGRGFQASPLQVAVALATVAALVAVALSWPRRSATDARVPPPWAMACLGFAGYLFHLPSEDAAAVAVAVAVIGGTSAVVGRWGRSAGWTAEHVFGLALGVTLTGVVIPFVADPYAADVGRAREMLDDGVAAAICLVGAGLTVWRRRRRHRPATAGP